MNCRKAVVLTAVILLAAFSLASAGETYFKFEVSSPDELRKLTRIISIDNVRDNTVFAYANDKELAEFERFGYSYEVLQSPGTLIRPKMATTRDGMRDWDAYPTYNGYINMMYQFAADYPTICEIIDIGTSVEGRQLLFAKISDNVSTEEAEPEVMLTSSMHGDELAGYVSTLRLIDSLLVSYGTDARITSMVDEMEIWINPLANPDGAYAGGNSSVYGATRGNANYVDLNRNFPDPEDGPHPDGNSWQDETVAMMNIAEAQNFILSANYHGGAEVMNYPWDTWSQLHADDTWFQYVSHLYADTAQTYSSSGYMDGFNDGITNGYAWYSISGGRQDYMTYFMGGREITMEISNTKLPSAGTLPNYWEWNKRSMLTYLEHGRYGIRGVVTDLNTGLPVGAVITVLNHDEDSSRIFSDTDLGDYYRMIEAGTWDLEFTAPGYLPTIEQNVVVTTGTATLLDVQLEPMPDEPALYFVSQDAGLVNPGDSKSMYITIRNEGAGDATGTYGTLGTDDPYITITQAVALYPTIAELGGQATSISAYQFDVDPACPMYHDAFFELYLTADGGYDDTVSFSINIGQQIEDFESGDFLTYPWEFGGELPWSVVTSEKYEGIYGSKSGNINDNQTSEMSIDLDVQSAGEISFYYKVSSEATYDFLEFYIDGVRQDRWSGEVDWTQATFSVSTGNHVFKWVYDKDGSVSNGSDCGWVDYIVLPNSSPTLTITTTSLPAWTENVYYEEQLEAAGGQGSRSWEDLNNDLDGTGLTLSTDGMISGTPAVTGTLAFTAKVEDQGGSNDEKFLSVTVNPTPTITTTTLPNWTVGVEYSEQLQATGGTGQRLFSDLNNDLSGTGLSITTAGVVSGVPTSDGPISFTARVQDAVGATGEKPFTFAINPAVSITTDPTLPVATVGESYSITLESTGGTGARAWTDKNGDLSGTGLTISPPGELTGNPATEGTIVFTAHAQDQVGAWDEQEFTLEVELGFTLGDVDGSGGIDIDDIVFLIAYVFGGGPSPDPVEAGDVNCSGGVDIDDIVFLIDYVFSGGDAPEC